MGRGAEHFPKSIAIGLQSVGDTMPGESGVPFVEAAAVIEALHGSLRRTRNHALHCLMATLSARVVSCTYHH